MTPTFSCLNHFSFFYLCIFNRVCRLLSLCSLRTSHYLIRSHYSHCKFFTARYLHVRASVCLSVCIDCYYYPTARPTWVKPPIMPGGCPRRGDGAKMRRGEAGRMSQFTHHPLLLSRWTIKSDRRLLSNSRDLVLV